MKKARPDLYERMGQALFDYVGECNKRNPTGETGFNVLHEKFGFACKQWLSVFAWQTSMCHNTTCLAAGAGLILRQLIKF